MSDFTTVDSSIISKMKILSKEIISLEGLEAMGLGKYDTYIELINKKNELNELIEKL